MKIGCGSPWHYESHSYHSTCPSCNSPKWDNKIKWTPEMASVAPMPEPDDPIAEAKKLLANRTAGAREWFVAAPRLLATLCDRLEAAERRLEREIQAGSDAVGRAMWEGVARSLDDAE